MIELARTALDELRRIRELLEQLADRQDLR